MGQRTERAALWGVALLWGACGLVGAAQAQTAGTLDAGAPAPVAIIEEIVVPPEPPEPAPAERGLFASAQVGLAMPLSGPLSEDMEWGYEATASAGLWILPVVAGFVELVGVHHPTDAGWSYTSFGLGVGARGVMMPELALHPFGEGAVLLHFVSIGEGGPALSAAEVTLGLTMSVGLELDLTETLSIELGVRPEFVFNAHLWPDSVVRRDNTFLLTPFAGGSAYF